jgi:hypothetical protein
MSPEDRRLVVDQEFDRAVEVVLDGFLREGFTIRPVDGGDLHQRCAAGHTLRYAMLEASLPELAFVPGVGVESLAPILGCRISLFELTGSCTLVTVSNPLTRYPLLSSLVPRLTERLGGALRLVAVRGASLEAA